MILELYFMKNLLFILLVITSFTELQSQIPDKQARDEALIATKLLKEQGVLVLRLETALPKIQMLERSLRSDLKPRKRRRAEAMLKETIQRRDKINKAIVQSFSDTFDFCPVYISFDTSAKTLRNGARAGIFYDKDLQKVTNISIPDSAAIFVLYYHEKSGKYPYDGLLLRKLESTLTDPFPHYTPIRESFIYEINTPRIRKAIPRLQQRLKRLYQKALKKEEQTASP